VAPRQGGLVHQRLPVVVDEHELLDHPGAARVVGVARRTRRPHVHRPEPGGLAERRLEPRVADGEPVQPLARQAGERGVRWIVADEDQAGERVVGGAGHQPGEREHAAR
jgi:hypothetical protein